jgi:hypothetical protein
LAPRRARGVVCADLTLDAAVDGVDRLALKTQDWTDMLDEGVESGVRGDEVNVEVNLPRYLRAGVFVSCDMGTVDLDGSMGRGSMDELGVSVVSIWDQLDMSVSVGLLSHAVNCEFES